MHLTFCVEVWLLAFCIKQMHEGEKCAWGFHAKALSQKREHLCL